MLTGNIYAAHFLCDIFALTLMKGVKGVSWENGGCVVLTFCFMLTGNISPINCRGDLDYWESGIHGHANETRTPNG